MLDVAVTIVNWNVRDLLVECLRSVFAAIEHANLSAQVWVVDNHSHDGSVEMVREQFPKVHLVDCPLNLWFGGGHNLALRALGFETVPLPAQARVTESEIVIGDVRCAYARPRELPRYVLLLNPDTLVRPNALGEMVRLMDVAPRAGVCGPRLVYGDGRFQHAAYAFPSLAQTLLEFWPINWRLTDSRLNGRYPRRLYDRGTPFPVDHPLGAAMLFRRETILETKGFDLDYQMYVEEIDWCKRIKTAGWQVFCVPGAEVVHYEGQSTKQVRPEMLLALWTSRYIYFRKHHPRWYGQAIRSAIRAGMRAKIRRARRDQASGFLDAAQAEALCDAYERITALDLDATHG